MSPSLASDVKMDSSDAPADKKSPVLNGNGHIPDAPPTNGNSNANAASPPKSPAPAVGSSLTSASDAAPAETVSSVSAPATESKPTEALAPSASTTDDKATTPTTLEPASAPGLIGGSTDGSNDKMQLDEPMDAPVAQPLRTELPHHPTTESATPSLPPLKTDYEMKDAPLSAPLSPSKVSRGREAEYDEEPAAKRTKVEGENGATGDIKLPELPTPATETARPLSSAGASGVTKMQHKFLTKCVQSLKRMHDARFYKEPVDPVKLNIPNYRDIITRPMDLGTIEKKLKNNGYSSPQEMIDDVHLMVQNSLTFNGPDHLVAQEGQKLKGTFDKQIANLPKPEEVEEKKPKKTTEKTSAARREPRTSLGAPPPKAASPPSAVSTTFALGPEGLPTIRRDSTNQDGRPKRSIHPPKRDLPYSTKPKKKKYQWELRFCQEVLDELHKGKHQINAFAFYVPVDPVALNIPSYHSVIKKPMDLQTMQNKLKTGQYENSKEFESDMQLMFKNCYRFNLPGDPTYICGQNLQAVFDQKWKEMPQYLEKHEPHPEQHSDSSEDESDEEAEESDNEDQEKLSLLQKQIAEMSRQVEMITQRKKKTPPAKKSISKSKSGKKDAKKSSGSSSKKDKKSGGGSSKASKTTRAVTYHEKQLISNGISSLPDKKMHEALGIIQSNVPALKV